MAIIFLRFSFKNKKFLIKFDNEDKTYVTEKKSNVFSVVVKK